MQNKYLEMMEATQKVISRANDISATAEKVTNMLEIHKDDLARTKELISGRFEAIRAMLQADETVMLEQIDTLTKELNGAVAALRGVPLEKPEDLSGFGSASGRPPGESPVEVSAELKALSVQTYVGGDNGA
jgi:hypothetical protein